MIIRYKEKKKLYNVKNPVNIIKVRFRINY